MYSSSRAGLTPVLSADPHDYLPARTFRLEITLGVGCLLEIIDAIHYGREPAFLDPVAERRQVCRT
jgi:hypothetical protein